VQYSKPLSVTQKGVRGGPFPHQSFEAPQPFALISKGKILGEALAVDSAAIAAATKQPKTILVKGCATPQ
jgi:hypothetical protein